MHLVGPYAAVFRAFVLLRQQPCLASILSQSRLKTRRAPTGPAHQGRNLQPITDGFCEEVARDVVVECCHPAEILETAEHAFDGLSRPIEDGGKQFFQTRLPSRGRSAGCCWLRHVVGVRPCRNPFVAVEHARRVSDP
jgi:hypothetical protein